MQTRYYFATSHRLLLDWYSDWHGKIRFPIGMNQNYNLILNHKNNQKLFNFPIGNDIMCDRNLNHFTHRISNQISFSFPIGKSISWGVKIKNDSKIDLIY